MTDDDDPYAPSPADEAWRRTAPRRLPASPGREVTESVARILTRDEALEGIGEARKAPDTDRPRHHCRRCGRESQVLVSVAGEEVTLGGLRLVGCVRTTCPPCVVGMRARDAGQA